LKTKVIAVLIALLGMLAAVACSTNQSDPYTTEYDPEAEYGSVYEYDEDENGDTECRVEEEAETYHDGYFGGRLDAEEHAALIASLAAQSYAWASFRSDMAGFIAGIEYEQGLWWVLPTLEIAIAKLVDPMAYHEIMAELSYLLTRATPHQQRVLERALEEVEHFYTLYRPHRSLPVEVSLAGGVGVVDWAGFRRQIDHAQGTITLIEYRLRYACEDLMVLWLLFDLTYGDLPPPAWTLAMIDPAYAEGIMRALTERIVLMRDAGFPIYRQHLAMLTHEYENVIDAVTQARFNEMQYMLVRHGLLTCNIAAWTWFRQEPGTFFDTVGAMPADRQSTILDRIAANIGVAKLVDPVLYFDIVRAMDGLEMSAPMLAQAQIMYDGTRAWWEEYSSRHDDSVGTPHFPNVGTPHFPNVGSPTWFDDIDWHCPSHHYSHAFISANLYRHAYHVLETFEQNHELGLLIMMFAMHYGVSGINNTCPIIFLAVAAEDTRPTVLYLLVERLAALQAGGFEIYRTYADMLTDPRRAMDPITQALVADAREMLVQREILNE